MRHYFRYFVFALFIGNLLQSCSDDLNLSKDIDVSISLDPNGFILPTSRFNIPLSQIIELKDSGELTVDSLGNYLFYKNGDDMDTTTVCIGQGSLCNGTEDDKDISLKEDPSVVITPNKRFPEFASLEFETDIVPSLNGDGLKSGIADLLYVHTSLSIDIYFNFEKIKDVIPYIDQMTFQVPSFYDLADESELTISNVSTQGQYHHEIHVTGVRLDNKNLREGEIALANQEVGQVKLKGVVKIKGKVKSIKPEELAAINDPRLYFRVMIGTMGTTEVVGHFKQVEDVDLEPIRFDNLPDFIKDDEVVIDVENPVVRMTLDNEVPASVSMNAVLRGIKNNQQISKLEIGHEYGTDTIAFYGAKTPDTSTRSSVWISRLPIPVPDSVHANVVIPNMLDIIRKMPDMVEILATARTDSNELLTLSLAKEYSALPRYELIAPLKMGPNMQIVYRKDIEDLHSSLGHVEFDRIEITSDSVFNNLPLALSFAVIPMDVNGKVMDNIIIEKPDSIPGFILEEGKYAESMPVKFVLAGADGYRSIKDIDTIILKIYAKSNEGLAGTILNEKHNLRMENVKITINKDDEE